MESDAFARVVQIAKNIFVNEKIELDQKTKDSVSHFLSHDEYEMGYEGLFIEMIKSNYVPSRDEAAEYLKIGRDLGLDRESVFDPEFWEKLVSYLNLKN